MRGNIKHTFFNSCRACGDGGRVGSAAPARCLLFRPAHRDECWYIISLIPASIYQVTCIHRHRVGDLMNGALSRPCLAAAAGLLTSESVPPPDRIFVAGRPAFDRGELIHYGIHKQKSSQSSIPSVHCSCPRPYGLRQGGSRAVLAGRGPSSGAAGQVTRSEATSVLHTLTARRCRPLACLLGGKRRPYFTLCFCHFTPTPHMAR